MTNAVRATQRTRTTLDSPTRLGRNPPNWTLCQGCCQVRRENPARQPLTEPQLSSLSKSSHPAHRRGLQSQSCRKGPEGGGKIYPIFILPFWIAAIIALLKVYFQYMVMAAYGTQAEVVTTWLGGTSLATPSAPLNRCSACD